jgi:hypothetical protein
MRKILFAGAAVALALAPAAAFAQASTATGVVGGAAAGAVVGGPVGAVVGGIAGGTVGAAVEPPTEVHTYVMEHPAPSVEVQERVVVGEALPSTVEIHTVPQHTQFAYAVVNNQRVVVDARTRKVVKIY